MTADNPLDAAVEYCGLMDNPDRLKVAEYALLVPSVRTGMEMYLDSGEYEEEQGARRPSELVKAVGKQLGRTTVRTLAESPYGDVVRVLAERRSELVEYGNMIFPVTGTILQASEFSADAMYGIAVSNGYVIDAEPSVQSRDGFVAAVKRSHQPALARAVAHILWNPAVSSEFNAHADSFHSDRPAANDGVLIFDQERQRTAMARPLKDWWISDAGRQLALGAMKVGEIEAEDVRVGCPFSFAPELLKRYYEHIVDAIELADCWPYDLADPETTTQISPLEARARYAV
jgi:hypothetical protein